MSWGSSPAVSKVAWVSMLRRRSTSHGCMNGSPHTGHKLLCPCPTSVNASKNWNWRLWDPNYFTRRKKDSVLLLKIPGFSPLGFRQINFSWKHESWIKAEAPDLINTSSMNPDDRLKRQPSLSSQEEAFLWCRVITNKTSPTLRLIILYRTYIKLAEGFGLNVY